jgi:5-methyltetrahydrofolate--homocysteine methyltransferase
MKKAVEIIEPYINQENSKFKGVVIVGTVKGDVHDIGKNLFSIILESNGFKVIDLGVDVKKELFTEKVREIKPDILGMSALLVSTVPYMEDVVEELKKEHLRDTIKIILGGRAVTVEFAKKIGVDAYGKDAIDGLKKCITLMEKPY